MATRWVRRLRELLDVDTSGATPGDALVLDVDGETWVPGAGGGGGGSDDQTAAEVPFTPSGGVAATDVQAAIQELDTEKATPAQIASAVAALSSVYQPLDSDLTALAALTTTAFGRSLLTLADQAALLSAAGAAAAAHVHDGADITTGTVADARIAATIARDSEVTAAIAAAFAAADGAGLADDGSGVLSVNVDGSSIEINADALRVKAGGITSSHIADGTITTGDLAFDPATQAELDAAVATLQPLDSDLTAIAALTTTTFGRSLLALADAAALRTSAGVVIGTDVEAHDADLTTIAGLAPSNDDILQRKSGAWTNRTLAQLLTDLNLGALYQPLDSDLTALAGLAIAADKLPYGNGSHTMALADFTAAARALLDDADASSMLSTLGVSTFIKTLLDDADAATARATLGVTSGGLTPGQILSYPTTFSGDTIDGSSTTPYVDVAAFDTKEVLNSRILHLQTKGASKDQRVRVTLGTTKAGAFDVSTAVAFGGILWSGILDAYLEIRLSTSGDSQLAIARIGSTSFGFSSDVGHWDEVRVGGSSISGIGSNTEHFSPQGSTFTLRFVRDGSNVITFFVGHGTAPMALTQILKNSDDTPFTATVSGTLARVEYAIHTPSGPGSSAQWDAYVDYLASV